MILYFLLIRTVFLFFNKDLLFHHFFYSNDGMHASAYYCILCDSDVQESGNVMNKI